jgi:phosphoribosyl 1,2-cyclic phosphate phosphodiesterase
MKITVLGCGSSGGVPLIGNNWGACDPADPRNRRTRVSILIEDQSETILVDTSPDMRQQLLACNVQTLSAVLFTHAHADHCHGIDELRSINWLIKKPIDIYAGATTMAELRLRFDYIFGGTKPDVFYKPSVNQHIISGPFTIEGLQIIPFEQDHGHLTTLGFRIGDFAYSTDVKALNEAAFDCLKGIKVWIVDGIREQPHPTHSHLEQTLQWIKRVKPEQAYLTHMNETMDYAELVKKLPSHVRPAYDGLVISC